MGSHALLSPSAAHRWLNCTASPTLEATVEDESSSYAEEGSLAHAYCARRLKALMGEDTSGEDEEIAELKDRYHTGEMDECVDTYVSIVSEKHNAAMTVTPDARLLIEVKLDFGEYVPESFGTSDAVIIGDGVMEVVDFKYGKGVRVSAEGNPQMMIYALGAWLAYGMEYDIRRIRMTIVQPRIGNLSEQELSTEELLSWADRELKPKAAEAFSGGGQQVPGDWCRFCKVKSMCQALADKATTTAQVFRDSRLITPKQMGEIILPLLPVIKSWLTEIEEFALKRALEGVSYPGYKLVEGRSNRKITDDKAVIALLSKEGYAESEFMKPAVLCGIGDLEKLVGKKRLTALCADYITKPQGKPTLTTADDKRPAYNAAADDFNDIDV